MANRHIERVFIAISLVAVIGLSLAGAIFTYADSAGGTTTIAKLQDRLEPCRLTER